MNSIFELTMGGISLVAVLYYLNQSIKRAGYIPAKYILALTLGEAGALVALYAFVPQVFDGVFAALALAAGVVLFHGGVKTQTTEEKK